MDGWGDGASHGTRPCISPHESTAPTRSALTGHGNQKPRTRSSEEPHNVLVNHNQQRQQTNCQTKRAARLHHLPRKGTKTLCAEQVKLLMTHGSRRPNKNMFVLTTACHWVTVEAYVLARHTVPRKALKTDHMKLSNKSVTKQNRATRRDRPCDPFALPKLNAVAVDAHRRLLKK